MCHNIVADAHPHPAPVPTQTHTQKALKKHVFPFLTRSQQQTNRLIDRGTEKASYTVACPHLRAKPTDNEEVHLNYQGYI